MSKHNIRRNKTCQNCGTFVDKNFCPHCGQENSDSRHRFHHLFTHFFFDFIHYDSAFWRTTKHLFLSPAKVSVDYMAGKRRSYVNPFSFYIFVSFVAFLVPSLLPDGPSKEKNPEVTKELKVAMAERDSLIENEGRGLFDTSRIDSAYRSLPPGEQHLSADGSVYKSGLAILQNIQDKERGEKALEFFIHNISKVLFIYMPIFAFWLWLFNNKKKRYYFDSGIFTLHFFSVLLLSITICNILFYVFNLLNLSWLAALTWFALILYITFYFFRANRVFYGDRRCVANLKSFALVSINSMIILNIIILYGLFVIYMVYV